MTDSGMISALKKSTKKKASFPEEVYIQRDREEGYLLTWDDLEEVDPGTTAIYKLDSIVTVTHRTVIENVKMQGGK